MKEAPPSYTTFEAHKVKIKEDKEKEEEKERKRQEKRREKRRSKNTSMDVSIEEPKDENGKGDQMDVVANEQNGEGVKESVETAEGAMAMDAAASEK